MTGSPFFPRVVPQLAAQSHRCLFLAVPSASQAGSTSWKFTASSVQVASLSSLAPPWHPPAWLGCGMRSSC